MGRRGGPYRMIQILAVFHLPLKIESNANLREHWHARAKRTKMQRWTAGCAVAVSKDWKLPAGRFTVRLVRIGRRLLDDDNLCSGFKAIRDGVADGLGVKDNNPRIKWMYAQEKGKEYSCRIELLATRSKG